MTIRVANLVEQSHLQIEVLAGADGLGRLVSWAHASDLPDPWNWLAGGELLMKNGRSLARSAQGQVAFFERLAAATVTALVIGSDPMTPDLTRRAAARADELSLPVLQVPYSMSFIAISRAVADASAEEQSWRLARVERIYASVHAASSAAQTEPGSFVGRLAAELGHRVHVVDAATARPVLGSSPLDAELDLALRDVLSRHVPGVPAVVHLPDRGPHSAVAVAVPFEEPTVLVATRSDGRGFDLSTLHHAAAATAVEVTHETLREDLAAHVRSALLAGLLGSEASGEAAGGADADLELGLTRSRLVAIVPPAAGVLRRVALGLRRHWVRHILVAGGNIVWLLLEDGQARGRHDADGEPEPVPLTDVATRLGDGAALGVSTAVRSSTRVPEAAREARFALGLAARRGGGIVHYGDGGGLPALRDPAAARALVDDVLGRVLAYDRENGTVLVASLDVFLANRRSWSRAATALHVHRQTVIYRMRRVAQLTGRDLTVTADLAELWLAVTAHGLLSE